MSTKNEKIEKINDRIKEELEKAKAKVAELQREKESSTAILNEYRGMNQVLGSYFDMLTYQGQRINEMTLDCETMFDLLKGKGLTEEEVQTALNEARENYNKEMQRQAEEQMKAQQERIKVLQEMQRIQAKGEVPSVFLGPDGKPLTRGTPVGESFPGKKS